MINNVAIIGAGLIGTKRAQALANFSDFRLIVVADINPDAAGKLASLFGAESETDWQKVIERADIDYVVVGTDPGSKYEKAKRLELVIIDENEFKKLVGVT